MNAKHFLRDSWLSSSYYLGLSQLYNALRGRRRGIISYHNTLPVARLLPFDVYNVDVTAAVFEQQLIFLQKHFRVLPIAELNNPKAKGFFLTVDDGMLNNYEILAPILEKYNITALFAICPDLVNGNIPHIWRDHLFLLLQQAHGQQVWLPMNQFDAPYFVQNENDLTRAFKKYVYDQKVSDVYELLRQICERNHWNYAKLNNDPLRFEFMNWQQINDLAQRGHDIASHTMSHRVLRFLPNEQKYFELAASKKELESQLNKPINTIVYPYGGAEIDAVTIKIAQEVGYTTGLMNVQQHNLSIPRLTLPRFAFPPVANAPHLHAVASGYKFLGRKLLNF